ncbi:MAG: hypothetical protein WBB45_17155 [Cyclobacteriaceae bacterium]
MNDNSSQVSSKPVRELRSLPLALTLNPVSTLRSQLSVDIRGWRLPLRYLGVMLLLYITVRVLTGYDPLENAVRISGEPLSQTPGIKTIKRAGYFLTRHFWTLLPIYAILVGTTCRVFFTTRLIGQRKWWKICLLLVGQMLFFCTLTIPLTYLSHYFYFLPFILEVIYLIPIISMLSGDKRPLNLIKGFFALIIGHGIYALAVWGGAIGFISLTT